MKIENDYELDEFYLELDFIKGDIRNTDNPDQKIKLIQLKDDLESAICDYEARKKI